jgi:hypothetical protein
MLLRLLWLGFGKIVEDNHGEKIFFLTLIGGIIFGSFDSFGGWCRT